MANAAPIVKPWGEEVRTLLTSLVKQEVVNINHAADTAYINKVWLNYFCKQDNRNFCCNFYAHAQAQALKDTISGTRQWEEGGKNYCLFFQLLM
jgi:hypothetical protein